MKNFVSIATFCMILSVIISFTSCTAQTPKGNLKTDLDSLSYAYGVSYTQGFDQQLMQMGISDEHKADFMKGFLEGSQIKEGDEKTKAQIIGQSVGLQLGTQAISHLNMNLFGSDSTKAINREQFIAGFVAAATKKDLLMDEFAAQELADSLSQKIMNEMNQSYLIENAAFLEENKKDPEVIVLSSGLQYKVVKEGNGPKPVSTDVVKVDYVGKDIHGETFDSSIDRGEPAEFPLNRVIPGWTEGIQLMPVGSKYILYIPYDLAYGESGRPGSIDPYATLIFEVELHDIIK